ncbi:MAG TPA: NlpC/P60 family protein [Pseudolysinimonas sp.]|nr:NlpC/P60 family protein [Pseudolysinimonas sp.]
MTESARKKKAAATAAVTAAFVSALVSPEAALATPMPDYPTWQDVQNARKSEAATAAEITHINGLLAALENQSADLTKQIQLKAELYLQAKDALDAATAKLASLTKQADAAQDRATDSERRAARLIMQLARTGGGDLTLDLVLSSSDEADDLLSRLGAVNKLSESSAAILERATFDKNLAASLAADASRAEGQRTKLADAAKKALDAAQQLADAATAKLAAQEAAATQMYAQLATLKNSTAETERGYQEGLTAEREQVQAAQPPVPPPLPATPPPGVDPAPPPPTADAVAQAIGFARAQIGDEYQLNGEGPDVWDCSGLTKFSYASAGVYIGTHSATNQYNRMSSEGRLVAVSAMQAGDLLYYSVGGSIAATKYHTAIYVGGGQMIEAPRPGVPVRQVAVRYGDLVPYVGRPTG